MYSRIFKDKMQEHLDKIARDTTNTSNNKTC